MVMFNYFGGIMQAIEIIVIVCAVLIVGTYFGVLIYKKIHHMPTGDCAECHNKMKKAVKRMKKQRKKEKARLAKSNENK